MSDTYLDRLLAAYSAGATQLGESPASAEAIASEIVGRYRSVALPTFTGRPHMAALLKPDGEGASYDGPLYVRILEALRASWNGDQIDAGPVVRWLCKMLGVSGEESLPPSGDDKALMTAALRIKQHQLFTIPGPLYNDINRALAATRLRRSLKKGDACG